MDCDGGIALDDVPVEDDVVCDGDCFGLASCISDVNVPTIDILPSHTTSTASIKHKALLHGQTRLVRIAPGQNDAVKIAIVIGEVTTLQGIRLVDSQAVISYTALSYCWGYGEKTCIECDGQDISISSDLLAAITHHRRSDHAVHLWIDALCIDQNNQQEKEVQVAMMLDIYMQAVSVTAWLGSADGDSALSFAVLQLKVPSTLTKEDKHSPACQAMLQTVFAALLRLYERSYLSRTWIRQETYIARRLIVACGGNHDWRGYLAGREWLSAIYDAVDCQAMQEQYSQVIALLDEARHSLKTWKNPGLATARDIYQVLRHTPSYGVTNENDSIYAVLRMCGIKSVAHPHNAQSQSQTFLIDYTRPSGSTYRDLTLYLLANLDYKRSLRNLWIYMVCESDESSWVMNWRSMRCKDMDIARINRFLDSDQETATRSMRRLVESEKDSLTAQPSRIWCPNWNLISVSSTSFKALPWREWRGWRLLQVDIETPRAKASEEDSGVLLISARALNYVAWVSNFSCSLDEFMDLDGFAQLGRAARSIHAETEPDPSCSLFRVNPYEILQPFDQAKHDRRIAILGLGLDAQLAWVPTSARKGDIVVALGDTLPMLLTPVENNHNSQFFMQPDPYERSLWTPEEGKHAAASHWYCAFLQPASTRTIWAFVSTLFVYFFPIAAYIGLMVTVRLDVETLFSFFILASLSMTGVVVWAASLICKILYQRITRWRSSRDAIVALLKQKENFEVLDSITQRYSAHYHLQGPVFAAQVGIWKQFYY